MPLTLCLTISLRENHHEHRCRLPNVDVSLYAVDGLQPEHQLNQRQILTQMLDYLMGAGHWNIESIYRQPHVEEGAQQWPAWRIT
jgi:hypothetical protein